jgi:pyruvate dehydrogenase E2 component (dihydrolipoamide acetyltransferase)
MSEFRLPSLGADMESATLREWFVKPGAVVKKGDIIASVETDKGIIDIEVQDSGTIATLLVQPDEKVPVGTVLATLSGGEATSSGSPASLPQREPQGAPKKSVPPKKISAAGTAAPDGERPRISPVARRRARELNVDLASITGSGQQGAITLQDVERFSGPGAPSEPQEAGMRRVIAAAMARSKREIPHYYLSTSIDITAMLAWLHRRNSEKPLEERMVYAIPLLKAVAKALQKIPELNGFFREGEAQLSTDVHVGMAISLRSGGLVVPALRGVQEKSVDTLMVEFTDLVSRARNGHLRGSEVQGATITVSSLGEQGVETVFPIIYPPQLSIVGFGSVVERIRPLNGKPAVRNVICASLAADHRVSDGHRGAVFLAEIDRLLQEPDTL